MKANRSVLTSVVPTTVVILLACLPLFAMLPILTNPRESQTLDVQPLDIQPLRVPTPPPVIDQLAVAATPAPFVLAMAPEPIPAPVPPVLATPDSPPPARVEAPEQSTAVAIPIANWREILAMALAGFGALIWAWLHRVSNLHCLGKECAS